MDFNDPNEPWRQTGFDPYKGMSIKERQQAGCIHGLIFITAVVVLIIIAALCHGCTTTKEVIVEKVRTDTVYQNHMQHDSIHIRDSVWVERWTHGDTVYVEKTTEKTKTLTWFERWRVRIGTIMFIALGLFALYCGIRFALRMKNKLP